ncbi:MAG TPA: hypothetical protein VM432_03945 [Bdellovibrionales bacterium]|jgi:hypothetical protein|nr:hypothetical protein [Bdellovibrionales bacterium]
MDTSLKSLVCFCLILAFSGCGRFEVRNAEPAPSPDFSEKEDAIDDFNFDDIEVDDSDDYANTDDEDFGEPANPTTPKPPKHPKVSIKTPAVWDKHPMGQAYTRITLEALSSFGQKLIKTTPSDIGNYCPSYPKLTDPAERAAVWVAIIAAITARESSFEPTVRYPERSMGKDLVTGKQIVSEGLLQLSYQDELNYANVLPKDVCAFDYHGDQRYPLRDIRRSIQDPKKNLECGVKILSHQVGQSKVVSLSKIVTVRGKKRVRWFGGAAYWAVLRTEKSHRYIQQQIRKLDICMR